MGDILSYSENQEKFITEVYRVLKKGGIFIGTVDNLNKFIFDAFFSKDFDIIEVMAREKKVKVGFLNICHFIQNYLQKRRLKSFY